MRPLDQIWRVLTLHCDEDSRLASESLDRPLSSVDRIAMRLHEVTCGSCRRFHAQILTIRQASKGIVQDAGPPLSEQARERIKRSLRDD